MIKNKLVLVVEDEAMLQKVIKKKLNMAGFDVIIKDSANEALKIYEGSDHVDCIWLDHYLKGKKDGIGFLIDIKKKHEKIEIPVFVVSNSACLEKERKYFDLGVKSFFVKSDYKIKDIIDNISKAV